jgi:membrane protease YdiL (CAAX protease family)
VTTALALHKLWDDGTLLDVFKLKSGDITIGLLVAGVLFAATWAANMTVVPRDSVRFAWLLRLYAQLAAPAVYARHTLLMATIVLIAVLEEISWRGFIQRSLEERFGTRRAWVIAAGLYALVHVSTAFGLRDPAAGLNPLLVVAALGAGLSWGFIVRMMGRLPPVLVSHAAFAYFAVEFNRPF